MLGQLTRRGLVAAGAKNASASRSSRSRAAAVASAALGRPPPSDGRLCLHLHHSDGCNHGRHQQQRQHLHLGPTNVHANASSSAPPFSPLLALRLVGARARGITTGGPSPPPPRPKEEEEPPHPDMQQKQKVVLVNRETVWTTPNLITMSRIAASPLLSWAILAGHYEYAVAGVAAAATTDWLDGYIAKKYDQAVGGGASLSFFPSFFHCLDCWTLWYCGGATTAGAFGCVCVCVCVEAITIAHAQGPPFFLHACVPRPINLTVGAGRFLGPAGR